MLGIFMHLCDMCSRLLTIVRAQQTELERMKTNEHMLDQWRRETEAIERMYHQIEK